MRTQHQKPIGEQWICTRRQCAAINFPKRPECYKCGSKRTHDKLSKFGKDDRDHKLNERRFSGNRSSLLKANNRSSSWLCALCGGDNWPIRDKCYQCRAPKKEASRFNARSNGKRRSSPFDFAHRKRNLREDKFGVDNRRFANRSDPAQRRRRDDRNGANESELQPRIKSIVSTGPNEEDVDISQFDLSDFATIDEAKREEQNKNRAEKANREKEKDNGNDRSRHSRREHKERKHEEDDRHKSRLDEKKSKSLKGEGRDADRDVKRSRRTRSESDEMRENPINSNTSKDSKKQEIRSNSSRQVRARSASTSSSSSSSSESSDNESSGSHKRSRKRTSASKRRYR